MNVIIVQGQNLIVKNKLEPKLSFGRREKPRFQKFDTCVRCGHPILRIKFARREYCDDCNKVANVTKLQSGSAARTKSKERMIKGLSLKEYRHQYYLKTVALGWRHY